MPGKLRGFGSGSDREALSTAPDPWGDTGAATHILCWGGLVFRVSELRKRAKKVIRKENYENRMMAIYGIA